MCSDIDASGVSEPLSQDVEWNRHGSDKGIMLLATRAWDAALTSRTLASSVGALSSVEL